MGAAAVPAMAVDQCRLGGGQLPPPLGLAPVPPVLAASAALQGFGLSDTAAAPHNAFLPCC